MGCVDGCHIPIKAPKKSPMSYISQNRFHSIIIQGVRDYQMIFTECYTGEVGSVHDVSVLSRSSLFHKLQPEVSGIPDDMQC